MKKKVRLDKIQNFCSGKKNNNTCWKMKKKKNRLGETFANQISNKDLALPKNSQN